MASIKYLNNITLEQNELQFAKLHPLGTAPSGAEGQVYYNTGSNRMFAHNGSSWYSINGDVEGVVSGNVNTLTASGTENITLTPVTAAVTNGGLSLATGDQIYDFVTGQGYITDAGVTSATAGAGISVSPTTGAITITNTDRGSSQNIFKNFAVSGQSTVVADSNNDTLTLVAGSNVTITTNATSDSITIAASTGSDTTYDFNLSAVSGNATTLTLDASSGDDDTVTFEGTTNEIEITTPATGDAGTVKIGLPNDVTIGNNLTVGGNLTVSGTVTTVNTETINLADNIITLNSNYTGTAPTENGGIEVERGTQTNVSLFWNETTDRWQFQDLAGTYNLLRTGDFNPIIGTDSDYTQSGVNIIKSLTLTDGVITAFTSGNMQSASTSQSGVVELATNAETATGTSTTLAVTPAGLASVLPTGVSSANHTTALVGDGVNATLTVNHNFGLTDPNKVMVQLVEVSSGDTVHAGVENRATNSVDFVFTAAPASNAYRALFINLEV